MTNVKNDRIKGLFKMAVVNLAISIIIAIVVYILSKDLSVSIFVGFAYFMYSLRGLYSYIVRTRSVE